MHILKLIDEMKTKLNTQWLKFNILKIKHQNGIKFKLKCKSVTYNSRPDENQTKILEIKKYFSKSVNGKDYKLSSVCVIKSLNLFSFLSH